MADRNVRSGDLTMELIGFRDDDGSMQQTFWRFNVKSETPIPIRAGTSSAPFIWLTGEHIAPKTSVLVDIRFTRVYGMCCCRKKKTFLHLADRRGWVVEPTRVPDSDWIEMEDYVDSSVSLSLQGQEQRVCTLNRIGVSEYTALDDLTIYSKDTWPIPRLNAKTGFINAPKRGGNAAVGTISASSKFLISDRRTVFTRLRYMHIAIGELWSKTLIIPRTLNCCRRTGRFATFLKLSDGRGYVLTNSRKDITTTEGEEGENVRITRRAGEPVVIFDSLRLDSVNSETGKSMLRWQCVNC